MHSTVSSVSEFIKQKDRKGENDVAFGEYTYITFESVSQIYKVNYAYCKCKMNIKCLWNKLY